MPINIASLIHEIIDLKLNNFPVKKGEVFRFFHGRGGKYKGLENILIDWYAPVFYIRVFNDDINIAHIFANYLHEVLGHKVVLHERKTNEFKFLGVTQEELEKQIVCEFGLNYLVKLGQNQNLGFFPDMATFRKELIDGEYRLENKSVLNLFSYTCSLSVCAAEANALEVHNIDMNSNFLNWGKENHRLNNLTETSVYYHKVDILKSWGLIRRKGPFDFVIFDPPSFQRGSFDYKKDYQKVVSRFASFVADDGVVVACLNEPLEKFIFIENMFQEFAPEFELIKKILPPSDFEEVDIENALKICIYKKK